MSRFLVIACVLGCGGAAPAPPAQPLVVEPAPIAAHPPAQPAGPAPEGTWRVDLEYPGWQARASSIAVDGSGIYIAGPVFQPNQVDVRRWGIAKLDRVTGAPLWSVLDNPPNGPMPEHLAIADGVLIVAGHESNYLPSRSLVFERRDPATGTLVWRARIPDATGEHTLGGIALTPTSLLYAATTEPAHATFGELALDTGKPTRMPITRTGRRGRHIAAASGGIYLLGDTSSNAYTLERLDASWRSEWTRGTGVGLRIERAGDSLITWFRTIEKHGSDAALAWTSPLVGDFVDVAVDDTGLYVSAMADASTSAYYALAKLSATTGEVEWKARTAEYKQDRPPLALAVDGDAIYLFGYAGDRWYVERRRKSDGAVGPGKPVLHALQLTSAPQLAR